MTDEEIKRKIVEAIGALKAEAHPLEFDNVCERATAHRLAVHIERLFLDGWDIDCEYDRNGLLTKELRGIMECSNLKRTDRILPDVIIHRRNNAGRENNLLAIELKKNSSEDECDKMKLQLLTRPDGAYKYQLGLYINISGGDFCLTWYRNGERVTEQGAEALSS